MDSDNETFEDYISIRQQNFDQNSLQVIRDRIKLHGFSDYLKILLHSIDHMTNSYKRYDFLYHCAKETYNACLNQGDLQNEFALIKVLCHGMYHLDNDCGITETLTPDLALEVQRRIVDLLDRDLEKYHAIMFEYTPQLKSHPSLLDCWLVFAGLIFRFNGYQAPYRNNPNQALADALGLTDLYQEYLKSKFNISM